MTKVFVTGIGLISALGDNLGSSWQNLIDKKSGIKRNQLFPELQLSSLGLIDTKQPAGLKNITQLVVASALQDAGLRTPITECAVVIGSSRSFQASWEEMASCLTTLTTRESRSEFR
ncbi:MAG: hypothetical protein HC908_15135, partial [Calothrix sp. SM1_7_51]|nr:hypothetical protein [Calothrix sp. SM1_7_51]